MVSGAGEAIRGGSEFHQKNIKKKIRFLEDRFSSTLDTQETCSSGSVNDNKVGSAQMVS